ncbi:MAG: STAS-like domain-containing protein [Cytophagales bacterium]|nr:STAS-like domain-containing protein [Cytophagales bacterium]
MNNTAQKISIAKDFSPSPAGRNRRDGPYTGEGFREDFLIPKLKSSDLLHIDLDGTSGYGSSFLEEAFGGLIRSGFNEDALKKKLFFHSNRPSYETRIWHYIHKAAK